MPKRPFELTVPVSEADHVIGPDDAKVTIVEYGDFECPYCGQAAPAVHLMLARYGARIRFAFRHFPQEEVHAHALLAAEAAESAASQGKFWPMHDLLFRRQAHLTQPDLGKYAKELELDMHAFGQEMSAHKHVARIREQAATGRASGVRATPGFYLDGEIFDVSFDLQRLYDAIDARLT